MNILATSAAFLYNLIIPHFGVFIKKKEQIRFNFKTFMAHFDNKWFANGGLDFKCLLLIAVHPQPRTKQKGQCRRVDDTALVI